MYIPEYTQFATTDSYKCMYKCKLLFCLHTNPNGVSPGVFALLLHSFLSTFTEQHLWKNSTHSSSIRHPVSIQIKYFFISIQNMIFAMAHISQQSGKQLSNVTVIITIIINILECYTSVTLGSLHFTFTKTK